MAKSLLKSTGLVSGNTFISRILGFVRDMVFAHYFGAGGGFDAFLYAFRIPNFMRRLFAEGAFSQAFVPILGEYREKQTHEEVQVFIGDTFGALGSVLLLFVVIAIILGPLITMIFAPGYLREGVQFALTTHMLRITFPYLLFISLTALCGGVLNTYDNFSVPALTPALLNITLIFFAVVMTRFFATPVYALAWGVFFSGLFQLLFQLPFLKQKRLLVRPRIGFNDPGVRRVLKLMGPAIFGVAIVQVSLLLDTVFASFLKAGSVSWLYYSDRLMNFPLGVFGIAIATVVLPKLSRQHAKRDIDSYSKTLDWSLRLLLIIGVPSSVGLLLLSGPLVSALFQYGRFHASDVLMTRRSLMGFAIGIQFFMLIKVLAAGFYARQNIKTPVKIALIALGVNLVFNFILIFPLAHAGLALSTSIAATVNSVILLALLLKRKLYRPSPGWVKFFFQVGFAVLTMALFILWQDPPLKSWMLNPWAFRAIHTTVLLVGSSFIYIGSLYLVGIRVRHFREKNIYL